MNISKSLPGSLNLEYRDEEWLQAINYDHIPFWCRKFHEHGHLFMDFPLTILLHIVEEDNRKKKEVFTEVQGQKIPNTQNLGLGKGKNPSTSSSFDILSKILNTQVVENLHIQPTRGK